MDYRAIWRKYKNREKMSAPEKSVSLILVKNEDIEKKTFSKLGIAAIFPAVLFTCIC